MLERAFRPPCLVALLLLLHGTAFAAKPLDTVDDAGAHRGDLYIAAKRAIESPDQALWSDDRIDTYRDADTSPTTALAVVRVPRLGLEAPVFEGALDEELDRGPGWIRGTARPGAAGNVGIAGHRDGFFRILKDIEPGDDIEVVGGDTRTRYTVTEIWVVDPSAVHVLDPTDEPTLTLVTCFPFYYEGHAPNRFIVRAVASPSDGR